MLTFIIELVTIIGSFFFLVILIGHEKAPFLLLILLCALHFMLIATCLALNLFLVTLTKKVYLNKECFDDFTYAMFSKIDYEQDIGLYLNIGGYAFWSFIEIVTYIILLIYFICCREKEATTPSKNEKPLNEILTKQ